MKMQQHILSLSQTSKSNIVDAFWRIKIGNIQSGVVMTVRLFARLSACSFSSNTKLIWTRFGGMIQGIFQFYFYPRPALVPSFPSLQVPLVSPLQSFFRRLAFKNAYQPLTLKYFVRFLLSWKKISKTFFLLDWNRCTRIVCFRVCRLDDQKFPQRLFRTVQSGITFFWCNFGWRKAASAERKEWVWVATVGPEKVEKDG